MIGVPVNLFESTHWSLLSTLIGRRVWLDGGNIKIGKNLNWKLYKQQQQQQHLLIWFWGWFKLASDDSDDDDNDVGDDGVDGDVGGDDNDDLIGLVLRLIRVGWWCLTKWPILLAHLPTAPHHHHHDDADDDDDDDEQENW